MEQFDFPLHDELLVKYLTGIATKEERKEALLWIHQSKANERHFDQLRDVYEASKTAQSSSVYQTDLSWERVKSMYYKRRFSKLSGKNDSNRLYYIRETLKYAALILVILAAVIWGIRFSGKPLPAGDQIIWTEVEAPLGSKSSITLSDGTKVWLNSGSKLRYSNQFGKEEREVVLVGEAYFHVTKHKKKPFIVKTGYVNVTALGTEFNVKAYPEENIIQTTLVQGLVTINKDPSVSGGSEKEIYLEPNQSVTFMKNREALPEKKARKKDSKEKSPLKEDRLVFQSRIDPIVYTSWKDTRWIIRSEQLSDLAIKLERRYNVKFQFCSESLRKYKFTGILRDETLEQVLNLMKLSAPIEYSVSGNEVVITENKSFKNDYDKLLKENE
jgi:transmembrane sensor